MGSIKRKLSSLYVCAYIYIFIYLKAKSHGACLLRKDLLWRSQRIKDLAYEEEAYSMDNNKQTKMIENLGAYILSAMVQLRLPSHTA